MKYVIDRLIGSVRVFLRILGFGAIGSVALAGLVAFRHILVTPQPLDSPLLGEAHLYRWKRGHVYYKVAGEQHSPPMVLLHTRMRCSALWHPWQRASACMPLTCSALACQTALIFPILLTHILNFSMIFLPMS